MFKNLSTQGLEAARDVVNTGYAPEPTDIYKAIVKMAYVQESSRGAMGIVLNFYLPHSGKDYKETLWVTSRDGHNYSVNKDTGKKQGLPGFNVVNDLCTVTLEKELADLDTENKLVPIWNYETKTNVPTQVPVLTELLGKECYLAIYQNMENKQVSDGKGDYVATAEVRNTNTIEKVMHFPSRFTVKEATDGVEEPVYYDAWLQAHKDTVRDKRTIKDGKASSTGSKFNTPTSNQPANKASIFGKKS